MKTTDEDGNLQNNPNHVANKIGTKKVTVSLTHLDNF